MVWVFHRKQYKYNYVFQSHNCFINRNILYFQEPNPEDPLNKEAAEVLQTNRRLFEQNVAKSMRGGHIGNVYFERCLK